MANRIASSVLHQMTGVKNILARRVVKKYIYPTDGTGKKNTVRIPTPPPPVNKTNNNSQTSQNPRRRTCPKGCETPGPYKKRN